MTSRFPLLLLFLAASVPLSYAQSANPIDAPQSATGSEKQTEDKSAPNLAQGSGIADNTANPGRFRVGKGVNPPKAVFTPDPNYPPEARKAGYEGTVVLWMIIDADGRPKQIKVSRSLGMGLDQEAVAAVQKWRFDPATKDGQPVAVQINVEVNFRLGMTPPQLPLHPSSATKDGHPEFPGADLNQYPLIVHISDFVPLPKGERYEVRATADVQGDPAGPRRFLILCESNARSCSTIWSGYYPARWIAQDQRLEFVGIKGNSSHWEKAQYSVQSGTAQP